MRPGSKHPVLVWSVGICVVLVFLIRLALPYAARAYVNHTLDRSPDYEGKVGAIDVHLLRGSYGVDDINIRLDRKNDTDPLFKAKRLELVLSWGELIRGRAKMEVKVFQPEVVLIESSSAPKHPSKAPNLRQSLNKLLPFQLRRLEIIDARMNFRNPTSDPPVDLWLREGHLVLHNLTNLKNTPEGPKAHCMATATTIGNGKLRIRVVANPEAKRPTFQIHAKLMDLHLRPLNAFFKKYAKFDFASGYGDIVSEVSAKDGKLDGYVKPLFKNVKIFSLRKIQIEKEGIFQIVWEGMAETAKELFKNHREDQLATKIPISGTIDSPDAPIFVTILGVLSNAFVHAFQPYYDGIARR